ncbi:MAG TPA: carboxypeptidase-like regulatory domain-containing protein [Candidatus Sulfotelmatobacter sp.]|nr:carboxypeptidase-like regulatory domain-containing protein [Candidatus Sulfotelmatobacter sp.]
MKKLLCVAALALACVIPSLPLMATPVFQRGRQGDSRSLSGRVFDRQEAPLQKAIVYLKNTKTLAIKTYITETDGSYRFPALAPNVDYEVYAEYQGERSATKTLSGFDSRRQANIMLKIK